MSPLRSVISLALVLCFGYWGECLIRLSIWALNLRSLFAIDKLVSSTVLAQRRIEAVIDHLGRTCEKFKLNVL
jgi:hypothetical protein